MLGTRHLFTITTGEVAILQIPTLNVVKKIKVTVSSVPHPFPLSQI